VSANSSTASGLRLGIGPEQVKAILGAPSIATPKKLVYYFGYKKKTNAEILAELRKNRPDMTDAEFVKNFEYADGEAYIEARFRIREAQLLGNLQVRNVLSANAARLSVVAKSPYTNYDHSST
jgi:hypothetical protein